MYFPALSSGASKKRSAACGSGRLGGGKSALPCSERAAKTEFYEKDRVKRIHIFLLMALCAQPFALGQDKSRILALENSWNQAELHNDAHAVDLLLADDFVMTVADGYTMNKAQTLASVRDTSYRPDALQSDDMKVHMYGNTAVVTG
jgi:Domain of unknown function (DUF4440)